MRGCQDVFTDSLDGAPRRQAAVRDARPQPGTHPRVVFCHSGGGRRRQSTFLCIHLSSHGYIVAARDHSEVVASELARREGVNLDPGSIGIVGHSFGGWTALVTPESEGRVRARW